MNAEEIIEYWYSEPIRHHWFSSTLALDAEIREKYQGIWQQAADGGLDQWQYQAPGSLALVLILDQFPLNMFRGEPRSFQTEGQAIAVARNAIEQDFPRQLKPAHLVFLFMPFMHSENRQDQELSIRLYQHYRLQESLAFAKHHRDIILRFGRFPHRNRILGRQSSPEELDYLNGENAFLG